MNWTHCSKGAVLGVLLAVSLAAVGTAAAVTVTGSAPDASQAGTQESMTITIENPFEDAPSDWRLRGDTELENASWTVTTLEQGRTIQTTEYAGQSFEQDLTIDDGTTQVEIVVDGTVPELTSFDYDEMSVENYTLADVSRSVEGNVNTFRSWEVHRYTEGSQEARTAIEEAEAALGDSPSSSAQSTLSDAKAFYDNQDWERAISKAEEAESQSGGPPLVAIVGVVIALVVIVGGVFYYRSQQDSGHKLQ